MENFFSVDIGRMLAIGLIGLDWLLRLLALFVVPRNRPPTAGMAWLMLIFFAPIPGWVIFLLIGNPKLPKHRRNLQSRVDKFLEMIGENNDDLAKAAGAKYYQLFKLAHNLTNLPLTYCDRYEIIYNYDDYFDRLVKDIDSAKQVVHVNSYILALDKATDQVIAALERAHSRGVTVYVLYDDYCRFSHRKRLTAAVNRLHSSGIKVQASLPIRFSIRHYMRPDLRNHRKIITIDHYIGYTGSQNLIDKTYHRKDEVSYKDLMVRLEGHVAKHMDLVFAADWYAETRENILLPEPSPLKKSAIGKMRVQVLPSGPGYADENNLKVFAAMFYAAERSITIVNPYFVPDDALLTAIISAASRGVRVVMVNSEVVDQLFVAHAQRSYYEKLLQAGVEVFLHKRPTLIHSKFVIIDEEISAVGSSNLDIRSLVLDSELTLLVNDKSFSSGLQAVSDMYLANSRQISLAAWKARPAIKKLFDNIARLTSALQ